MIAAEPPSKQHAWLTLSRASNLPTVWSNCLAGWALAGGSGFLKLAAVCLGASLIYTGGMFLNDAVDAEFDRRYRKERPIPSGTITEKAVWLWGGFLLVAGVLCLFTLGLPSGIIAVLLALVVVLYDLIHKRTAWSPLVMATCRFLLYVIAASTGARIPGFAVWCGLALASYVIGLTYFARSESTLAPVNYWPGVLLIFPIALAGTVNDGHFHTQGMLFSGILATWLVWSFRPLLSAGRKRMAETVAGLLAGIIWVDMLAAGIEKPQTVAVFIGLFVVARLAQKLIPAT